MTATTADLLDAGLDRAALARLDLATMSVPDLAAWLRSNGAAHLSPIERIELAEKLTRRRFIIGAGALGLGAISGCGPGEQAAAPTATVTVTTRRVVHGGFETDVPANPQRIVALQSLQILDPLLAYARGLAWAEAASLTALAAPLP